jgi:hypothetical protein
MRRQAHHVSCPTLLGPVDLPFARQDAVARLDQLAVAGMSASDVADQIAWGRWQRVGPTVVVAHNAPLTSGQQEWACVLGAGPPAALCGRTAAKHCGLDGWDDGRIHVLVVRGSTPPGLPLPIAVHESRRYVPTRDAHPTRVPPMTRLERSLVDAAAWTQHPRRACGLLIVAVQQRLTQPSRLLAELDTVGRVRHRRLLRRVPADVEGGTQALSEVDFGHLCRRLGLPAPYDRRSVWITWGGVAMSTWKCPPGVGESSSRSMAPYT